MRLNERIPIAFVHKRMRIRRLDILTGTAIEKEGGKRKKGEERKEKEKRIKTR